ncbi:MAG: PAS domain-containing protein [Proteobacteria bacterium]|nr:PAS domain-containing protein [Pseudomonadota bacterium]MBI3498876.1 PAS domain-containing protein [Pseudomonadota bacterium]
MAPIQWKLPETLQSLHDYWRAKRIGAALPPSGTIAVAELPQLAADLMLLEPIAAGDDFRYRVMGEAVIQATGIDCTGRRMREVLKPGPYLDYLLGLNREVLHEKRPLYSESSFRAERLSNRWTCRLILPLAGEGEAVGMIMAAQVFGGLSPSTPAPPFSESAEFEEGVRVLLD